MSKSDISRRIRELRQQRGLSQAQLAKPELSDSYISLIESGNRPPTPTALEIIARKLNCSVDYLVRGVESEEIKRIEKDLESARQALQNGAKDKARKLYKDILSEPSIAQLPDQRHAAEYGLALATEACGDLDEAIRILLKLRGDQTRSLSDEIRIGSALALSRCHRDRGEIDQAINVAEREVAAMIEKGWTDHLIELGATLLAAYFERGDLLRAEQYAAQLLAAAEELGTPRAIVATNWNAAILAEYKGQYEEALTRIERAWEIQSVVGEPRNRARLHSEYISIRLRVRPEEAAACRDELFQVEQELRATAASTVDLAYCKYLLCRAEIELGHAEAAVEYALDSIRLIEETNAGMLAESQVFLARAYQMLNRVDEAARALKAAAEALAKEPTNRLTAELWLMAAAVWQDLGDQKSSRQAYQRAMECGGV